MTEKDNYYKSRIEEARAFQLNNSTFIEIRDKFTDILLDYFRIADIHPESMKHKMDIIMVGLLKSEDEEVVVKCLDELCENDLFSFENDALRLRSYDGQHCVSSYKGNCITEEFVRKNQRNLTVSPFLYVPKKFGLDVVDSFSEVNSCPHIKSKVVNAADDSLLFLFTDRMKYNKLFYCADFDTIGTGIFQDCAKRLGRNYIVLVKK